MSVRCDINKYDEWYSNDYPNAISKSFLREIAKATRADIKIWRSMKFDVDESNRDEFINGEPLTNGQVLEVSGILCRRSLVEIQRHLAGRHGPVSDQEIYDTMCAEECLMNDNLREEAIVHSSCSCLELSTMPDHPLYKSDGDWCKESSGQMLCDEVGGEWCGEWECAMDDFHCRRIEYNTIDIPLKGLGGSCSGATHFISNMQLIGSFVLLAVLKLMR